MFSTFTTILDNLFKHLCLSGVGAVLKHTEGISKEENLLWSSDVLNVTTPLGLVQAVFFSVMENIIASMEDKNTEIGKCRSWNDYIIQRDTYTGKIHLKIGKMDFKK